MAGIQNAVDNKLVGSAAGLFQTTGNVGYVAQSSVLSGSAISLTSGTVFNLTSVALPAGNFRLDNGNINYAASPGSTGANSWVSTSSATIPNANIIGGLVLSSGTFNTQCSIAPGVVFSLSAATTIYLSGVAAFTSGTCTASGTLIFEQMP